MLFYNGQFWNPDQPYHNTWMVIDEQSGKITSCGKDDPPMEEHKLQRDMNNQFVFPGFHDSHLHISENGRSLNKRFNLDLPKTVEQLKTKLKQLIGMSSKKCWFRGFGWDHNSMDRLPNRFDIDEIVTDRPVALYRVGIHIAVFNSRAFELLGINKSNPADCMVDRFPIGHEHEGDVTGILREKVLFKVADDHLVNNLVEERKENIELALNSCLRAGLTSVHPLEEQSWDDFVQLSKEGKLPVHCYFSMFYSNFGRPSSPYPGETHHNLTGDCIKIFADGALGTQTASLSQPYSTKKHNGDDNYGVLNLTQEELEYQVDRVNKAGFRLEIHVIGDQAADSVLTALENCRVPREKRPILVHCQILRPDLLERMYKCGVVPTIQPSFVPTDSRWIKSNLPKSLKGCIYPWKTLLNHGIICGGSSDSPVETIDPLVGIYDAIFREDLSTDDRRPFIKEECLSFKEAVDLYTTGSAYADCVEDIKGKLQSGYNADFVVLDVPVDESTGQPFDLPNKPRILRQTKVKEVWVAGKLIHCRE